jgi:two-component system, OmpR family, response regulator
MSQYNKIRIFLVDDDAVFLKLCEIEFLQNLNFEVIAYPSGELCLKNLWRNPDIIILDYYLDSINKQALSGIETLDRIKKINADILVTMLSSQDNMSVALDCIQHKAVDYLMKKKEIIARLPQIISTIFSYKQMEKELRT